MRLLELTTFSITYNPTNYPIYVKLQEQLASYKESKTPFSLEYDSWGSTQFIHLVKVVVNRSSLPAFIVQETLRCKVSVPGRDDRLNFSDLDMLFSSNSSIVYHDGGVHFEIVELLDLPDIVEYKNYLTIFFNNLKEKTALNFNFEGPVSYRQIVKNESIKNRLKVVREEMYNVKSKRKSSRGSSSSKKLKK